MSAAIKPRQKRAKRQSAEIVHLAPADTGSLACRDKLIELSIEAARGNINGVVVIAFAAPGSGSKRYRLYTTGLADSDPTLAVGAMASCQALLYEEALEKAGLLP